MSVTDNNIDGQATSPKDVYELDDHLKIQNRDNRVGGGFKKPHSVSYNRQRKKEYFPGDRYKAPPSHYSHNKKLGMTFAAAYLSGINAHDPKMHAPKHTQQLRESNRNFVSPYVNGPPQSHKPFSGKPMSGKPPTHRNSRFIT